MCVCDLRQLLSALTHTHMDLKLPSLSKAIELWPLCWLSHLGFCPVWGTHYDALAYFGYIWMSFNSMCRLRLLVSFASNAERSCSATLHPSGGSTPFGHWRAMSVQDS